MQTMIKEYLTSIIRNLLAPVVAYLLATGYFTENEVTNFVGAVAVLAVAVIWGLLNKFWWKEATATALQMSPTTSKNVLNDVISGEVKK